MYIADMHCDTIMMLWLARREGKAVQPEQPRQRKQQLQASPHSIRNRLLLEI